MEILRELGSQGSDIYRLRLRGNFQVRLTKKMGLGVHQREGKNEGIIHDYMDL